MLITGASNLLAFFRFDTRPGILPLLQGRMPGCSIRTHVQPDSPDFHRLIEDLRDFGNTCTAHRERELTEKE
jgi:hypothetical protein